MGKKNKADKAGSASSVPLQEMTEMALESVREAIQQATASIKAAFQAELQTECSLDSLRVQAKYVVGCGRMAALEAFLKNELAIEQATQHNPAQSFEAQSEQLKLELQDSLTAWQALTTWLAQRQPDKQAEIVQKVEYIQSLLNVLLTQGMVVEQAMKRHETTQAPIAIVEVATLLFKKLCDGNLAQLARMIKSEQRQAWRKLEGGAKDNLMALTEDALECVFHELKYVELWRAFSMRLIQLTRLYVPILVAQVSDAGIASDAERSFFESLFTEPALENRAIHGFQQSLVEMFSHYQRVCQARDQHQLRGEQAIGPLLQMAEQAFAAPWLRTDAAHHFVMLMMSKICCNLDANAKIRQEFFQLLAVYDPLATTPFPQILDILNEYIRDIKIIATQVDQIAMTALQAPQSMQEDAIAEEMRQLTGAMQEGQVGKAQAVAGRAIGIARFEMTRALVASNKLLPPGGNPVSRVRICLDALCKEVGQIVDLAKGVCNSEVIDEAIAALQRIVVEVKQHGDALEAAQSVSARDRAICALHLVRALHESLVPITAFGSQTKRSPRVIVFSRILPVTDLISCVIQQLLKQQDQAEDILMLTEANELPEKTKIAIQLALQVSRIIDHQANIATLLIYLTSLCLPIIFDHTATPDRPLPLEVDFAAADLQQNIDWYMTSLKSMITHYQAIQTRSEPVPSDAAAESMLCHIRAAVDLMAQSRARYLCAFASLMTWRMGRLLFHTDSSVSIKLPYDQIRDVGLMMGVMEPEVEGAKILIKQNQERLRRIDERGKISYEEAKAVAKIARKKRSGRRSGLFMHSLFQDGAAVNLLLDNAALPPTLAVTPSPAPQP
jgi:hypothetical protein